MNISIDDKDIVLILVGVVGSVVANYIYKSLESSNSVASALERDIQSTDPAERTRATRQCMFIAGKFYIFANIFWVVSGAAWIFGNTDYGATLIVLGASSVIAVFLFWLALRWLMRAQRGDA